ncbi:MAG: hypothetical protein A2X49_13960 [Lentisphaerae bacterium GWF2_52_8]|nr:MAG: hypothetical protein A2X49_13960 [Lentisphaerae bacterium GWF2_52_8]
MLNIVLLPATEPYDKTYGEMPRQLKGYPQASIHHVSFPRMVWYNREVRGQALEQIAALSISPLILVGFSKSGLGAWNITRTAADIISATIIFDAPVSREALPGEPPRSTQTIPNGKKISRCAR